MAKSLRSKKKKRLRTIRREIVEPVYEKKEAAKIAAQEAALNASKLPIPPAYLNNPFSSSACNSTSMDVEMADGTAADQRLKPSGGIGKKMRKKLKFKKVKHHGKKIRRKNI